MRYGPGRPPLDGTTPIVSLHIRVTPAQRLYLQRVADQSGRRVAEVLREAIDDRRDADADDAGDGA